MKHWLACVLGAILGMTACGSVHAGPVALAYDNPVLHVRPGESIDINATLIGPFVTNSIAQPVAGPPVSGVGSLFYLQAQKLTVFGSPAYFLAQNSKVTFANSTPLTDIQLGAGSSLDLVLGTFQAYAALPAGVYTTDIGISQQCASTFCVVNFGDPPNFLDPGILTIVVESVPESSSYAIFLAGLIALFIAMRGRVRRPQRS